MRGKKFVCLKLSLQMQILNVHQGRFNEMTEGSYGLSFSSPAPFCQDNTLNGDIIYEQVLALYAISIQKIN